MLTELRDHLTPRRLLLLYLLLIVVALVVPWFPTYAPIRDAMTLRHLEAQGRSPAQMREREAAARREAEELARQREAEQRQREAEQRYREAEQRQQEAATRRAAEEQARRQQEADRLRAQQEREAEQRRLQEAAERDLAFQYTRLAQQLRQDGGDLWDNVYPLEPGALNAARHLQSILNERYYRTEGLTPEETATRRVCGDPASVADQLNRTQRRDHNIKACAVYVATTSDVRIEEKVAVTLLDFRLTSGADLREKLASMDHLVAYIWLYQWRSQLRRAQDITALPELTEGDSLNPRLFSDALSPGFARRMIETGTTGERLRLSREVYPALVRLADLSRQVLAACRAARRSSCFQNY